MGMGFPFASARRAAVKDTSSGLRLGRRAAGAPFFDASDLPPGDPNPERFKILCLEQFGPFCVAVIQWPDASNYDGQKVAVYRATPEQLRAAKTLDPHFQEKRGPLVPIARFEPTTDGISMANSLARALERTAK